MVRLFSLLLAVVAPVLATTYLDYDNDFVDPSYILGKDFASTTAEAQQSIVEWADFLAVQGPWCMFIEALVPHAEWSC